MHNSLSPPSVTLPGTAIHSFPAVQHQEPANWVLPFNKLQICRLYVLYEHQLSQATELEGSQLIDTYLLQARVDLTRLQLYSGQVQ